MKERTSCQNTRQKIPAVWSEGEAEGGGWGEEFRLARAEASGGGAERSKFAVRIFVKKSSDFVQQIAN